MVEFVLESMSWSENNCEMHYSPLFEWAAGIALRQSGLEANKCLYLLNQNFSPSHIFLPAANHYIHSPNLHTLDLWIGCLFLHLLPRDTVWNCLKKTVLLSFLLRLQTNILDLEFHKIYVRKCSSCSILAAPCLSLESLPVPFLLKCHHGLGFLLSYINLYF